MQNKRMQSYIKLSSSALNNENSASFDGEFIFYNKNCINKFKEQKYLV